MSYLYAVRIYANGYFWFDREKGIALFNDNVRIMLDKDTVKLLSKHNRLVPESSFVLDRHLVFLDSVQDLYTFCDFFDQGFATSHAMTVHFKRCDWVTSLYDRNNMFVDGTLHVPQKLSKGTDMLPNSVVIQEFVNYSSHFRALFYPPIVVYSFLEGFVYNIVNVPQLQKYQDYIRKSIVDNDDPSSLRSLLTKKGTRVNDNVFTYDGQIVWGVMIDCYDERLIQQRAELLRRLNVSVEGTAGADAVAFLCHADEMETVMAALFDKFAT